MQDYYKTKKENDKDDGTYLNYVHDDENQKELEYQKEYLAKKKHAKREHS